MTKVSFARPAVTEECACCGGWMPLEGTPEWEAGNGECRGHLGPQGECLAFAGPDLGASKFVNSGADLADYFEAHGGRLWKAADPTEGARWVETLADAQAIASEDPSLLYAEEF